MAALRFISSAPSTMTMRQPSSAGGQPKKAGDLARILDHDLAAQPAAPRIIGALDGQEVGMAACRDAAKHPALGIDRQARCSADGRRRLASRSPAGSGRSGRPASPCRCRAARSTGCACGSRPALGEPPQLALGPLVTDKIRVRPRRRNPWLRSGGGPPPRATRDVSLCGSRPLLARGARGERGCSNRSQFNAQPFLHGIEHGAMDRLRIFRRVDQHAAYAVVGGDPPEALTAAFRGRPGRGARNDRSSAPRAAARARPSSTGRSRITVRSGAKSPRAKRCSAASRSSASPLP